MNGASKIIVFTIVCISFVYDTNIRYAKTYYSKYLGFSWNFIIFQVHKTLKKKQNDKFLELYNIVNSFATVFKI